jgi:hypothetical protein
MQINEETGEVEELSDLELEELGFKKDFYIDSLEACEWYINKINSVSYRKNQLKKNYEAMLSDLEREEKSLKYLFENQFVTEIKKHIPEGKKSLKTLVGQVQFRACKANIEVDELEAIPPNFILEETKIVRKPDKEAIIKAFESGLSPDGVRYIPERDSLTIK